MLHNVLGQLRSYHYISRRTDVKLWDLLEQNCRHTFMVVVVRLTVPATVHIPGLELVAVFDLWNVVIAYSNPA
jgi:hypothetical protein